MVQPLNRNRAVILPDEENQGFISGAAGNAPDPERIQYDNVDDAAAYVNKLWKDWEAERIDKESVWLECEKAYLSQHSSQNDMAKWKSKAFVPVSYNAVENIHAQLMSGLFPNANDFFEVDPLDEDYVIRAGVVKEMLKQQLLQSGFRGEFSHFVKQLITIGSSAAIVDWDEDDAGFRGSRLKTIDMKYFHVDPYAGEPHLANKMRRYWMTPEEAELSGIFDEDSLEAIGTVGALGAYTNEDANRITAAQASDLTQGIDPDRGGIEITELWGTFEIDGKIYENHVLSIGNGAAVLRFEASPYMHGRDPFIFTRYTIVPGEVYGIGALEPALPLQFLINTFTNQKVDELSIVINGMYKYVDDGVIDTDNIVSEPGALFEVGDIENIQNIAPSQAVALAYTEIADLERKFEEATGALKLVVGGAQSTGDRTTATEVLAITQSGNARFNETLAHVENTAFAPALRLYVSNAAQFMSQNFVVKAVGEEEAEEWLSISPEDIKGNYSIRPGGSRLVGVRELRLRNLMQYAQVIGQVEALATRMDWNKFNSKIWKELGFDADENMLKDEQPPATPALPAATPGAPAQGAGTVEQIAGGLENVATTE